MTRMRRITEDITDLVLEFDGSLSGEHGDGLARSEWNRKMFGDVVYDAFCKIKYAFDPHNLFNPGKIVHAPPMTENLRYGPTYHASEPATLFDFSKQEGFARSIEMCNGNGVCRKLQGGTMCPSFRATRDEKDSTRGRANVLRLGAGRRAADEGAGERRGERSARSLPDVQGVQIGVPEQRRSREAEGRGHATCVIRIAHGRCCTGCWPDCSALNRWGSLAAPLVNLHAAKSARPLDRPPPVRHRPPPQFARTPLQSLPPLVRQICREPKGERIAANGAAARRLLHDVQRTGDRQGGSAGSRSRRLRRRTRRADLLWPNAHQQGLPARSEGIDPGASPAPGRPDRATVRRSSVWSQAAC